MNEKSFTTIAKSIAIVTLPFKNPEEKSPQTRVSRFAAVLAALVKDIFIITGNFSANVPHDNVSIVNVKTPVTRVLGEPLVLKGFRFLSAQFTLSSAILRLPTKRASDVDAIFFFGGEALLIPVMISKLLGKKVIFVLRGSFERETQIRINIFSKPLSYLKRVNMALADKIIIYAECLVSRWNLERYQKKILVAPYLFVDSQMFRPANRLVMRGNIVGFIGRLDSEKGILNFIQAMRILVQTLDDVRALVIGDGQLRDEVKRFLEKEKLADRVKLTGWIAHHNMPDHLNQLKLLVLPSYTEGLPNILLEAMACGTPVLTTAVGSIPDIITDSENGFLMEDNTPECVARNVIRVLSKPNLDEVSYNACVLAKEDYSLGAVQERWHDLLANLNMERLDKQTNNNE